MEGKVLDFEGVRWVGGIEGGIEGLRAQIVNMLQGVGVGLTSALGSAGQSLYMTLQGRKQMMEKEESPEEKKDR